MAHAWAPGSGAQTVVSLLSQAATDSRLFEWLIRQSPVCTWLLNSEQEFHAVFGDAAPICGRSVEQLLGLPFASLFPPTARAFCRSMVSRVFSGETVSAPGRFCESAGTSSVTLFPVRSPEGDIVFAGGFAQQTSDLDLVAEFLEAQAAERARLSRLLHDRMGPYLSAAGLQLDLLRMDLEEAGSAGVERTVEVQGMLEKVMALVRDLSRQLQPPATEQMDLPSALERLAARLSPEFPGTVGVVCDQIAKLPPQTAAVLYRIAEEAAGNAIRHTSCSDIVLLLKSVRSRPVLEVRDNGCGFELSGGMSSKRGLSMLVMEHYASRAGIDLQIETAPGKGTVVRALCSSAGKATCA